MNTSWKLKVPSLKNLARDGFLEIFRWNQERNPYHGGYLVQVILWDNLSLRVSKWGTM